MKNVVVQIGNSDDKLSQLQWALFVSHVNAVMGNHAAQVHFFGSSLGHEAWQNACWVIAITDGNIDELCRELTRVRKKYDQESVAFMEGNVTFL